MTRRRYCRFWQISVTLLLILCFVVASSINARIKGVGIPDRIVKAQGTEQNFANILTSDFEDGQIAPWTGGKYSELTIVENSNSGNYAVKVVRNSGASQCRMQARIFAGDNVGQIPNGKSINYLFNVRSDEASKLNILLYANYTNGSKYVTLASKIDVGTSYKSILSNATVALVDGILSIEWRGPGEDSHITESWTVGDANTELISFDIVLYDTNAQVYYFDDIEISVAQTLDSRVATVIDMISAIGDVTVESEVAIVAAETAYDELTEQEKNEVFNYNILVEARETLQLLLSEGATYYRDLFKWDFENESVEPWTGGKYADIVIVEDSNSGDYAAKAIRKDGASQCRMQARILAGEDIDQIPSNQSIDYSFNVKSDTPSQVTLMLVVNFTGGNKSITLVNKSEVGTDYEKISANITLTLTNGILTAKWLRPDMSSYLTESWNVGDENTELISYDLIFYDSGAQTYYFDDIKITTPITISSKVIQVVDMISAIGEVTVESENAIVAAEVAYSELTQQEKSEVFNYNILIEARETLQRLLGEQITFYNDILVSEFEDRSISPWSGKKYSILQIVDDSRSSDYALKVMRQEGSTQCRMQTNLLAGNRMGQIPNGKPLDLYFSVKSDMPSTLNLVLYINYTGGIKSLNLVSRQSVGTSYQDVHANATITLTDGILTVKWKRPDMSAHTAESWTVGDENTELVSFDLVFYDSDADSFYFDDIKLTTPVTLSGRVAEVVEMINSIGKVTKESESAIIEVEAAYNELTEGEKEKVFNYDALVYARRNLLLIDGPVKADFDNDNVIFRFGAVSDTHNNKPNVVKMLQVLNGWGNKPMDALVIAGDISERVYYDGRVSEIPEIRETFEHNLSEDVDIFFVLGNHDSSNSSHAEIFYDGLGERFYRTEYDKEFTRRTGNRHSLLNGYHFIAIETDYDTETIPPESMDFLRSTLDQIVSNPEYDNEYIFVVSHTSPAGTVANSSPIGTLTPLVKDYPQVILLTGHSHNTVYDERNILQTDFTTVCLGSVSYSRFPGNYLESMPGSSLIEGSYTLSVGTMIEIDGEGNVKITRIDFTKGEEIAEPWILPAPKIDNSHLLAYPRERQTIFAAPPSWGADARASLVHTSKDTIKVTFDAARDDFFVYSYLIELYDEESNTPYRIIETLSQFYLYPQAAEMPDTKIVELKGLDRLPAYVKITGKNQWGLLTETIHSSMGEEPSEEPKDEEPKDEEPKDEEPKDEEPKGGGPVDPDPKTGDVLPMIETLFVVLTIGVGSTLAIKRKRKKGK